MILILILFPASTRSLLRRWTKLTRMIIGIIKIIVIIWHHPHHCLLIEQILHSSKCFDFENILRSDDIEEVPDLTTARYYLTNF